MGFISTANTNTLELSLTDYGKSVLVGNTGGDLFNQIVKFGLKDGDIDYRRFTAQTSNLSYGPCYGQSILVNSSMESLSGNCFYNYPDIRGRYGVEVCDLAVLQGPTTDGSTISFNPPTQGSLWYTTQQDMESKFCFSSGYDVTRLGLNEYGCKCTQFGLYDYKAKDDDNIKPGYATYRDVVQMYYYLKNPRNFQDKTNFKVGDFTGEGDINCKDFCWVVSCYIKGKEETMITTNKQNNFIGGQTKQVFEQMLRDLGCNCPGFKQKPIDKGSFICPADKLRYKNTQQNRNKCRGLTEKFLQTRIIGDNKNSEVKYLDLQREQRQEIRNRDNNERNVRRSRY